MSETPTHYYYAAYEAFLPHEILAFKSETYRDKWLRFEDCEVSKIRPGETPESRIAISREEAVNMIGLSDLDDESNFIPDIFDEQIQIIVKPGEIAFLGDW